jgi:hypothetical protein
MSSARFERLYPYIAATALAAAFAVFQHRYPGSLKNIRELFSAAMNVAGIAVGFLITSKALLFSIIESAPVRAQKQAGTWSTFVGYILDAIKLSFGVALLSGALIVFEIPVPSQLATTVLTVWFWLVAAAVMCVYRVVRTISAMLTE